MGSRTRATISSAGRGCSRSRTTAASSGTGDVVQVRRRSNASCPAPARAQPQETCMFLSVVSIGTGAALGAWLRWGLGLWLNPHHATLPLGTLAANLVGGYGVGLALGWFGIGRSSWRARVSQYG